MTWTIVAFVFLRVLSALFMILLVWGGVRALGHALDPLQGTWREIRRIPGRRYARGEINREDYRQLSDDLRNRG